MSRRSRRRHRRAAVNNLIKFGVEFRFFCISCREEFLKSPACCTEKWILGKDIGMACKACCPMHREGSGWQKVLPFFRYRSEEEKVVPVTAVEEAVYGAEDVE